MTSSSISSEPAQASGDPSLPDKQRIPPEGPQLDLKDRKSDRIGLALAVLLPAAVFLIHASIYGPWLVDDAGISFAYASNLADGYGLVAQPGVEPVEGFSNFAWVFLLAPFFKMGLFAIPATPKILSVSLVILSFLLFLKSLSIADKPPGFVVSLSLVFVSLNPAFVVWVVSGLENPLLIFLSSILFFQVLSFHYGSKRFFCTPYMIAVVITFLSLTRPDGIIYAVAFPVSMFFFLQFPVYRIRGFVWKSFFTYTSSLILSLVSFLAFRYFYFHDLFPNTYYAKGGPGVEDIRDLLLLMPYSTAKMSYLFPVAAGLAGTLLMALVLLAVPYLAGKGRLHASRLVLLALLGLSIAVYVLLPDDWMGEFRFATAFFLFYSLTVFLIVWDIINQFSIERKWKRLLLIGFFVLLASITQNGFAERGVRFSNDPPVPLARVIEGYVVRYQRYSEIISTPRCSVLLPDVGGMLFASDLKVYDLGGLTDRVIARAIGRDKSTFYDYVFEEIKPTFIDTHGVWAKMAAFEEDQRFARDYAPILTFWDSTASQNGEPPTRSGVFVRVDAISRAEIELLRALPH